MSSNYWQIKKQSEQYRHGNTLTSKIEAYVTTWEERCYSDGIPDEIPEGLSKSLRAPSYKAIAIAILKNDMTLKSLGFSGSHSEWYDVLKKERRDLESPQIKLI